MTYEMTEQSRKALRDVIASLSLMSDGADEARRYAAKHIVHHEPFWHGYKLAVSTMSPLLTTITQSMVDNAALDLIVELQNTIKALSRELKQARRPVSPKPKEELQ